MNDSAQPAGAAVADELKNRLEDLPLGMYDMIKSLVFTCDVAELACCPPCAHTPPHAIRTLKITRIDENFKPPQWMQANHASHSLYFDHLFRNDSTFVFSSVGVMKKWISAFPSSGITKYGRDKVYCIDSLDPLLSFDSLPATAWSAGQIMELWERVVESFDRRLQQLSERTKCKTWLSKVVGDPRLRLAFADSEDQVCHLAQSRRCVFSLTRSRSSEQCAVSERSSLQGSCVRGEMNEAQVLGGDDNIERVSREAFTDLEV